MNKNAIALSIIWMIVMLPIVEAQAIGGDQPTAGGETTAKPLFVNATIPRYPRTTKIDVAGVTKPGATVTVLVNGAEVKKDIINDGTFLFKNVPLLMTNTIIVRADLGSESASQTYQADVDSAPPLINVSIASVVTAASAVAKVKVSEPVNLTVQIGNETNKSYSLNAGSNDVPLTLLQGENMVGFTAVDKAGFKSFVEERVVYDTGPPRFESTNLDKISPSYRQEIDIKGKLSEPGSVTAFVNGRPQKTVTTDADGSFSVKVKLERPLAANSSGERVTGAITGNAVSIDAGIQWKNRVRLEAIDAAGLKASTPEVEIAYALCGSGTWIDVVLTDPMPDILNPRLIIEGIQQIGIAFNYTYRGGAKAEIDARNIKIRPLVLAPDVKKEYDNGLVQVRAPNVRAQKSTKPSGVGYIQVNFNKIDDPWLLPEKDGKTEPGPANATMFSREERLSEHRAGDCVVPGLGCMKLFLELEIPFTETTRKMTYDPHVQGTLEKDVVEPLTQRTCIDVSIAIDKRVPPDVLPSNLLKTISKTLGTIVETIDKILKPIQTIGKYLFYTCVAGQFLSLVPIFLEKYNCEFKKVTDILSGGQGAFDPNIASINACDAEYGAGSDSANNCNTCSKWKDYRKKFVRTYRQVCDRVMCPAAPSLQYYLKTRGREAPKLINTKNAQGELGSYIYKEGKLAIGSDCAAWIDKNKRAEEKGTKKAVLPPRLFFTTDEVQKIYDKWLTHQTDTSSETGSQSSGSINCAGLHPATPDCCGFEYMQEWSSACGVSALGQGLDTFDEIKESTCLSAQQAGKNDIAGAEGQTVQCNKLLNAVSGFCEKNGMPPLTPIRVTTIESRKADELELQKYAESNELYIIVQEKGGSSILGGVATVGKSQGFKISLGLIVKTLEFQKSDKPDKLAISERSKLTEKLDVVEYPGYTAFQEQWFSQAQIDEYRQKGDKTSFLSGFKSQLCEAAGKTGLKSCNIDANNIYGQVIAATGTPDKEYIIKPSDGLINSIRCLCFPTIVGYLKQWRNIMGAVKSCVDTIILTGDGENGVCQAVVSQYVCDLLYDILACFTQKFSTGSSRIEKEGGGDIMGALVASGSEMSREVEGRYGETGLYKAVFVDKKLVHSICMFAFTGTWDFNLGAIYDQSVDQIPLNSQALLTPCNRRFVAFNPSTRPGGLVTWVYHFGAFIASGADIDAELHLVCSDDFSCKESDGYENGKCDCQGKGKRDAVIRPENLPSRIKKNQIVSEEIFYTMQAGAGESNVRYDKAYLVYRWKEANKQMREEKTDPCSISQTGGGGSVPAFCRFDPFTFSFRCMFGEAAGGIRFKGHNVVYAHPTVLGGVFAKGENVAVELQLQQDYPGGDQYNKYLQYTILSPQGTELTSNKDRGLMLLQTNGDFNKKIAADGTPPIPIEIKREWFGGAEPGKPFIIRQWTSKNPKSLADNKVIDGVSFTSLGVESKAARQFVLELKNTGGKTTYNIYSAYSTTNTGQGEAGGFGFATPALTGNGCSGELKGNRISCAPQAPTAPGRAPLPTSDSLTVTLKPDPQLPTTDETIQSYISLGITSGADPCVGDVKGRPVYPLKMKLTAYDADQYGQPTEQVSIDSYTGAEAVYEISFNAVCATADELKPLEGILGPADVLSGLATSVKPMVETEIKLKSAIEGFLTKKNPQLGLQDSLSVQNALDDVMNKETESAGKLQIYFKNLDAISGLPDIKQKTAQLYNMIRLQPPLEQAALPILGFANYLREQNINYQADQAKKAITTALASSQPTVQGIREALTNFLPYLDAAIKTKTDLLTLLPAAGGVKGPCQSGQTDSAGYYVCGTEKPGEKWIQTDQQCLTTTQQTCFQLPSANQCPTQETTPTIVNKDYYACGAPQGPGPVTMFKPPWTVQTDKICYKTPGTACWGLSNENFCTGTDPSTGDGYHCEKECTGNAEIATGKGTCLTMEESCCVIKSNTLQKIINLKKALAAFDDSSVIAELLSWDSLSNEDILGLLYTSDPAVPPQLITTVNNVLASRKAELKSTGDLYDEYVRQGVSFPLTVDTFIKGTQRANYQYSLPESIKKLEAFKASIFALNKPTVGEVKAKIEELKLQIIFPMNGLRGDAIREIDKDIGIIEQKPAEKMPLPVQPPATQPPKTTAAPLKCGNGVIDTGEICDVKDGNVIVIDDPAFEWILFNPDTDTVSWGQAALPSSQIFFYKNLDTGFCYDIVGEDCNDKIEYSAARGKCFDNCKSFMPRVTCVDDDVFGDDGRGAYLVPKFTVADGTRKMQDVYQYLYSDPNFGNSATKNMCYPANPEPGTPPVNTNWIN